MKRDEFGLAEIYERGCTIDISKVRPGLGPNGYTQWSGKVKFVYSEGFEVTANWAGDEGRTTGKLVDFEGADAAACEATELQADDFAKAISAVLYVPRHETPHVIATKDDVEREARNCCAE
jgi:hypothetical protein